MRGAPAMEFYSRRGFYEKWFQWIGYWIKNDFLNLTCHELSVWVFFLPVKSSKKIAKKWFAKMYRRPTTHHFHTGNLLVKFPIPQAKSNSRTRTNHCNFPSTSPSPRHSHIRLKVLVRHLVQRQDEYTLFQHFYNFCFFFSCWNGVLCKIQLSWFWDLNRSPLSSWQFIDHGKSFRQIIAQHHAAQV